MGAEQMLMACRATLPQASLRTCKVTLSARPACPAGKALWRHRMYCGHPGPEHLHETQSLPQTLALQHLMQHGHCQ